MDSILFPGLLAEREKMQTKTRMRVIKLRKLAMGAELVSDFGAAKFFIVQ